MKVLIIGGSVFVGKAITRKFIKREDDVYVLNRGNHAILKGAKLLKADRNNAEEMQAALEGYAFDLVIDNSAYERVQTEIAYDVLKGRVNRYIHISTSAVYLHSEVLPYREDFKRGASKYWGSYSKNKYEIEEFLFEKHRLEGFPVTILRPFYLYGTENNIYREKYVFSRLLNNRPVLVAGMGTAVVQFGHVDDLAEAVSLIANNDKCIGQAYNVSGEEYVSLKGWVDMCAEALGIEDAKIVPIESKSTGYKTYKWFPFREVNLFGDCSKLREDTGFVPKYSLIEGLKKTVEDIGIEELKKELHILEEEKAILETLNI